MSMLFSSLNSITISNQQTIDLFSRLKLFEFIYIFHINIELYANIDNLFDSGIFK